MSIPPTLSISFAKLWKLTTTMWLMGSPVYSWTVRAARRAPPIWKAALILSGPWPGIFTFRSRGIDSTAIRFVSGSTRTSRIVSDRGLILYLRSV